MIGEDSTINNLKFKIENLKLDWKWILPGLLSITIIFFLLRLINLTILPVFADEAIYIRWAQVMRAEPTLRFLPLSDGKQPLFMWLVIPFLRLVKDPLVAGRVVSVFSGFASLVGLFLVSWKLFQSKRLALLASLFYAVVPFAVFFDRMALVDSLLAMFGIWVFYLGLVLAQHQRLDLAMITGMVLGAALLTKSPAIFFALLLPSGAIILIAKSNKSLSIQLIKLVGLWFITYVLAYGIYNIQRLGPNFSMITTRNADYVFPISHAFTNPLDPFQFHLAEIWSWFFSLTTWPIFLAGLAGMLLGLRRNVKSAVLLLFWLFVPLLVQAELAKVFTARYIFGAVPLFLIFAALSLDTVFTKVHSKIVSALLLLFMLALSLKFDYLLLTSPDKAPLPRRERSGYLEEWTAGTGIKEAADYLKEQAKTKKILVGTEGFFGTLPDGLQMYLQDVPDITIIGVGINIDKVPPQLVSSLKDNEVYLLINDERLKLEPKSSGLTLLASYPKAERPNKTHQSLLLFLVNLSGAR